MCGGKVAGHAVRHIDHRAADLSGKRNGRAGNDGLHLLFEALHLRLFALVAPGLNPGLREIRHGVAVQFRRADFPPVERPDIDL